MQKVIAYVLVECCEVRNYLDDGWQPWGSAIFSWNGRSNTPHQPIVKYDEEDSALDTKGPLWRKIKVMLCCS